jgi:hypothetical protein
LPKRILFLLAVLTGIGGCNGKVYLRDGVTDGDTFYLSQQALLDDDPVLQSWVSYSLTRSTCQLQLGGDNPARNSSYSCELTARRHLVESWNGLRATDRRTRDQYLDELSRTHAAGYLDEYVLRYFNRNSWTTPEGLEKAAFDRWHRENLRGHKAETRLVGSWNFAHAVNL